ncbi:DUF5680 domain-containing protein [Paenibacillus macerans]|uniref:DUF5680 domain-containing protein n=1 Tax=Paenibacillus macerans TaxID=44252 RepID=UPI002040CBC3|nr:DUF5680 domain-containing protein [Paenibacillus macerans]MCM3697857.1 DUF5680 domain-containing protein [Paenibacillus macerans]
MKNTYSITNLEQFIVAAKSKTYVGGVEKLLPYRLASKDIQFVDHEWSYHDSYFGDQDFIGQEVVYFNSELIWAMNYYGYILDTKLITQLSQQKIGRQALM